eukprot:341815-Hanusia_phi.AAC.1
MHNGRPAQSPTRDRTRIGPALREAGPTRQVEQWARPLIMESPPPGPPADDDSDAMIIGPEARNFERSDGSTVPESRAGRARHAGPLESP